MMADVMSRGLPWTRRLDHFISKTMIGQIPGALTVDVFLRRLVLREATFLTEGSSRRKGFIHLSSW